MPKKEGPRGPYKLNDFVMDRIITALRAGNFQEHAAAFAGISAPTYFRWMNEGRKAAEREQEGETLPPDQLQYKEFYEACEEAKAQAVIRNVSLISQAAQSQWQAAAWWLERTNPARFGRRNVTEVVGADNGPVQVNVSNEELEGLIRGLLSKDEPDDSN